MLSQKKNHFGARSAAFPAVTLALWECRRGMGRTMASATDDDGQPPESLLPYDLWTEAAMRQVMRDALNHVARDGLPGAHHFYITLRTDYPGVTVPSRLRAQYPEEMTIVLQHQFWDLSLDPADDVMRVGLSFGGVGSILVIPVAAIGAFADPHARFMLRFPVEMPDRVEPAELEPAAPDVPEVPAATPQIVQLDAFRRRTPPKS